MQMVTLVPGAPLVDTTAPLDLMTGLGINTTVNGSRTNASLLTVDGGFNMDAGSNNSQISNVGIDFIDQVSVKTSNFSAEYGRNSGAAINVVTRSGSNAFKGSVFEYMRRDGWDENDYFNDLKKVAKPTLTYDDFGFSLGGPISKDKIFFFGGVEWKRIRRLTSPVHAHAADQPDARRELQPAVDGDQRPADRPAVPGQHHPREPDHGRRPGHRERL